MINKKYFYLIFALIPQAAFGLHQAATMVTSASVSSPIFTKITSQSHLGSFFEILVAYKASVSKVYFTHADNYTLGDAIAIWYSLVERAHPGFVELLPVLKISSEGIKKRTIHLSDDLIAAASLEMRPATDVEILAIIDAIVKKQAVIPFVSLTEDEMKAKFSSKRTTEKTAVEGAGAAKD